MIALSLANSLLAISLAGCLEETYRFPGCSPEGEHWRLLLQGSGNSCFSFSFCRVSARMAAHFRQAEMELTMTNYKHLSLVDRAAVESSLDQGRSLTAIAHTLSRATATISREVNRHAVSSNKVAFGRVPNRCVHRLTCKTEFLCEDKPNCRKTKCSLCRQCNDVCDRFLEEACTRLSAPP